MKKVICTLTEDEIEELEIQADAIAAENILIARLTSLIAKHQKRKKAAWEKIRAKYSISEGAIQLDPSTGEVSVVESRASELEMLAPFVFGLALGIFLGAVIK